MFAFLSSLNIYNIYMTTLTFLFIIVFLIGLFFYAKCSDPKYEEGLTNNTLQPRCPDLLIQKDSKFYLYNSKVARVPGVNPVEFDNLEDYTEFLDWQRSQGIRCPVLYLQQSFDAQGNPVYKVRPSVSEPQGGLPPSIHMPQGIASSSGDVIMETSTLGTPNTPAYPNPTLLVDATQNDQPYNKNSYPAFDQTSYYVGTTTPLDAMNINQEKQNVSPDPMDPNWGGSEYTQSLVDKGYYAGNEVQMRV
jgi:hypothetical protein